MFAVIKTGGKQYRVAAEDVIRVDRVNGQPGEIVEFGEVLAHERGDKVIAFKKRRRKNSRRKRGYRHEFSVVRITEILTDGAKPSQTPPPRPKRESKPKPEASAEGGEDTEKKAKSGKSGKSGKGKKPAAKAGKKTAKGGTKGKKK